MPAELRETTSISHSLIVLCFFFESFVFGLHIYLMNLGPFSARLFGFFGLAYFTVLMAIPHYLRRSILETGTQVHSYTRFPMFAQGTWSNFEHLMQYSWLNPQTHPVLYEVARAAMPVVKFLYLTCPYNCAVPLAMKIFLYMKKLQLICKANTATQSILFGKSSHIWTGLLNNPPIAQDLFNHRVKSLKTATQEIINCVRPHEPFDETSSLQEITLLNIAWTALKFFIVPSLLLCYTALYSYRHLHPKVRS